MKPIVIENKLSSFICRMLLSTPLLIVWPFILIRDEKTCLIKLNKSKIKWHQLTELFVLGRFVLYLWDYVEGLIKYKSFDKAHRRVRFEQELLHYGHNMTYLAYRPVFGWVDHEV